MHYVFVFLAREVLPKVFKFHLHHKLIGSQFYNGSHAKKKFIGSYEIDMDVNHLFMLFEYRCCVHCLDMNVICIFILFKHRCYMFFTYENRAHFRV